MLQVCNRSIRIIQRGNISKNAFPSSQLLILQSFLTTSTGKPPKSGPLVKLKAYAQLAKFQLTTTVVGTTAAGYLLAGGPVDIKTLGYACLGTFLCSSSAATFNQVFEVEQDKAMHRTTKRPLPSGAISIREGVAFGAITGICGPALLYTLTNPTVAMLGLGNILLYSGIYTYSKRVTEWNTWIGAVVGAVPPLMGWAAATNNLFAMEPLLIGSLLYLWQFPHFFALNWLHRDDYSRGGFQMVSVNDPTGQRTADLISKYSSALLLVPLAGIASGEVGSMFLLESTVLTTPLLYLSSKFSKDRSKANARRVFGYSIAYLLLMASAMVFHSKNWDSEVIEAKILEEGKEDDEITELMLKSKETMKGYCIHEKIDQAPHLCPKIVAEKTIDTIETQTSEVAENKKKQ